MARETQSPKYLSSEPGRPRHQKPAPIVEPPEAAKMRHLIMAAEDIFLAKGYHTATMNDVAKAAGMSKKTVYQLIESKAGLFASLLEYHQEKLVVPAVSEDSTAHDVLVRYLLSLADFMLSPQQISIIRLIMAEYTHGRDFGRVFHQKRVIKAKTMLENCLMQICPPFTLKLDEAREMAAMLFGMALGEFILTVLVGFRPIPTKAALTRRIRLAVDLCLTGCPAIARG